MVFAGPSQIGLNNMSDKSSFISKTSFNGGASYRMPSTVRPDHKIESHKTSFDFAERSDMKNRNKRLLVKKMNEIKRIEERRSEKKSEARENWHEFQSSQKMKDNVSKSKLSRSPSMFSNL